MTQPPDHRSLLSREFIEDPHAFYRELRREGVVSRHVVKTFAAEMDAWVVTGYEEARELLADPRLSKDAGDLPQVIAANTAHTDGAGAAAAPPNPRNMLFSDPPDHTRLRRLIGKAFTMRRVEKMRRWIEETTDGLLDTVVPGQEFDLVEEVALALPIYVIGNLLGVPSERFADIRHWNSVLTNVDRGAEEKKAALAQMYGYMGGLIASKRERPGDDMVSALLGTQDDGAGLDDGELLSTIFLVMNAGYETTANMISSGVLTLLRHPEARERLRADPALLPGAIEEFLRHEGPLNLATIRFTTAPVRVGDVLIPPNAIVFVSLLAANRDAKRFVDPDRFDIGRPTAGHLAFGHGIHHCLGAPLARLEGEVVFRRLLDRFPSWELAVPDESLRWRYSLQFRGLDALPVRLSRGERGSR
ncbi:cytochrome P450 [Streptomyces sp. NPDC002018]|uniref:cytochrome P450 family protein n=1 Tax=Streptomyces sp. NPDC002018 TaxID=3364629 RepID=UPI0036980EE5